MVSNEQQPQEREKRETMTAGLPLMIHPDMGKWMLDSREEWEDLELILSGWKINSDEPYDANGKINWKQGTPLMNDKGRKIIINTLVRGVSHKGVFLSNLNDNETYEIAKKVLNDVAKSLACFTEEFGIDSMAEQQTIMDLITTNIMAILKRPFQQGERDFFKKFTTEKRIIGSDEKKGYGMFGGSK